MDYIPRRILTYIGVVIVALNLDFFLPRLVPGNAAEVLVPGGSSVPVAEIKLLEARFGLDQSLYVQYYLFLKNMFTWPPYLGVSYQFYPESVWNLFVGRIGWTMLLIVSSLILSIVIAYAMAGVSSLKRGGKFETGSLYSSIAFQATPIYWTGMVLLWVFGVYLKMFPIFGSVDITIGPGTLNYVASVLWHSILPILAMTASIFGENYLILRGAAQEVLKSDYVTAAKTRGLKDRVLASAYILRNSLLPLVSLLTFSLASMIGRVVLVESVFGYPGVGDLLVDAIVNRDYPVLEGTFFLVTILVVVGGIIGDLILIRLDPRLRGSIRA